MILITNKKQCSGCEACATCCPKHCITMKQDEEGFFYPQVDASLCVKCGLCDKICPMYKYVDKRHPIATYAMENPDVAVRLDSSSGGLFNLLAEQIISEGGSVFGAKFDNDWKVIHGRADTTTDLKGLRKSKYSQSRINRSYADATELIKQGKKVLFSGTPCQIAGLSNLLKKDYENLLLVEVACHGVPSPKIWHDYLKEISEGDLTQIKDVSFRDKQSNGWRDYHVVISGEWGPLVKESHHKNSYMQCYIKNLTVRPSCFSCRAKAGRSGCDITVADLWGRPKSKDDNLGTCLVMVYSEKGRNAIEALGIAKLPYSYHDAIRVNSCIEECTPEPICREIFWKQYTDGGYVKGMEILRQMRPPLFKRLKREIKEFVRKLV